jgi:hypothetical protein
VDAFVGVEDGDVCGVDNFGRVVDRTSLRPRILGVLERLDAVVFVGQFVGPIRTRPIV